MSEMSGPVRITAPLTDADTERLKAGDRVLISGVLYTARDAAHKRFMELLDRGEKLPFDVKGQIIYYVGPTPAKPGQAIGSAGPTTSMRMDVFTPRLLQAGLKATIGKGGRSQAVRDAMKKYKGVYLGAIGGLGAILAKQVKSAKVIAYEDLGAEAIRLLEVEDFPVVVVNDIHGGDLLEQGKARWRRADVLER